MNGKYPLTTKPPRQPNSPTATGANEATALLREILKTVNAIHMMMNNHLVLKGDPVTQMQVDEPTYEEPQSF